MELPDDDPLPDWANVVLAHARPPLRDALSSLIRFDVRLARIVSTASEPVLGQLRLAWWREELGKTWTENRPLPPDPLLANLLSSWSNHMPELQALVDGWEQLLDPAPWETSVREKFCAVHAGLFEALAAIAGAGNDVAKPGPHGHCWALVKLSAFGGVRSPLDAPKIDKLPPDLRSLSMIGGLSRRALKRGSAAIFGDRFSPLVALRLGIFGT